MGSVVRCGDLVEGGAGVVRAPEFWVDRVGEDVGTYQSGATTGVARKSTRCWIFRRSSCNLPTSKSMRTPVLRALLNSCNYYQKITFDCLVYPGESDATYTLKTEKDLLACHSTNNTDNLFVLSFAACPPG